MDDEFKEQTTYDGGIKQENFNFLTFHIRKNVTP